MAQPADGTQSFYSNAIIAKKGALGQVWLAAHMEKKLGKNQILRVNVGDSVAQVVKKDNQLALRISGHLLLGIVRIHARQVDYLLEDAGEAVVKVRLAFKPAPVDLAPENATRRFDEVTNPTTAPTTSALDLDLDFLDAPFEPLELPALGARRDGEPASASARLGGRGRVSGSEAELDTALPGTGPDLTLAAEDARPSLAGPSALGGLDAPGGAGGGAEDFAFGPDDGAYAHFAGGADDAAADVETLRRDSSAVRGFSLGPGSATRAGGAFDLDGTYELPLLENADGTVGLSLGALGNAELQMPELADQHEPADVGGVDAELPPLPDVAEPPPEDMEADGAGGGVRLDGLDDVLGADAAAQHTPTVGVDGTPMATAAARRARRRGAAALSALVLDDETQISNETWKEWLAHAAHTTTRRSAGAADAEDDDLDGDVDPEAATHEAGARAYARSRAAVISAMDAAELFAAPIVAGDPPALQAAYRARPYRALHADGARRSSAKRRRTSTEGGEGSGWQPDADVPVPPMDGLDGELPEHGPADQDHQQFDQQLEPDAYGGGGGEWQDGGGAEPELELEQPPPHTPPPDEDEQRAPAPPPEDEGAPHEVASYGVSLPTVDGAEDAGDEGSASGERVGWSKRTQMMFSLLNKTFASAELAERECLSYRALANHTGTRGAASRKRVVAGCFQELLFLTSADLISLRQDEPYGDVLIAKTGKFDTRAAIDGAVVPLEQRGRV